jgi:hypothetical protein
MKRKKPVKKVLIKRERPQLNEYDYIYVDSDKFSNLITAHIGNPSIGTIFKKPSIRAKCEYTCKKWSKTGIIEKIILLIIGAGLTLIVQMILKNID